MLPGVCKTEGMNGIKKEEIRNEESLEERLKDFEGEKLEDAPIVKTDWEHLMIKYFGCTGRAFTLLSPSIHWSNSLSYSQPIFQNRKCQLILFVNSN